MVNDRTHIPWWPHKIIFFSHVVAILIFRNTIKYIMFAHWQNQLTVYFSEHVLLSSVWLYLYISWSKAIKSRLWRTLSHHVSQPTESKNVTLAISLARVSSHLRDMNCNHVTHINSINTLSHQYSSTGAEIPTYLRSKTMAVVYKCAAYIWKMPARSWFTGF